MEKLFVAFNRAVNSLKARETPKQEQICIKKHKKVKLPRHSQPRNRFTKACSDDDANRQTITCSRSQIPRGLTIATLEQKEPLCRFWLMASGPSNYPTPLLVYTVICIFYAFQLELRICGKGRTACSLSNSYGVNKGCSRTHSRPLD